MIEQPIITNYLYLLKVREFIKTGESIYKIGKTKQSNNTRFNQYPKGSILLLQINCKDCDISEKNIINKFKKKYKQVKDIGTEYFEGNHNEMIKDIFEECYDPKNNICNNNICENIKKNTYIETSMEPDKKSGVVSEFLNLFNLFGKNNVKSKQTIEIINTQNPGQSAEKNNQYAEKNNQYAEKNNQYAEKNNINSTNYENKKIKEIQKNKENTNIINTENNIINTENNIINTENNITNINIENNTKKTFIDGVNDFLNSEIDITDENIYMNASDILELYRNFCNDKKLPVYGSSNFYIQLRIRFPERRIKNNNVKYKGFKLKK